MCQIDTCPTPRHVHGQQHSRPLTGLLLLLLPSQATITWSGYLNVRNTARFRSNTCNTPPAHRQPLLRAQAHMQHHSCHPASTAAATVSTALHSGTPYKSALLVCSSHSHFNSPLPQSHSCPVPSLPSGPSRAPPACQAHHHLLQAHHLSSSPPPAPSTSPVKLTTTCP